MPYFKRFAHFTKTVEDSNNGSQYVLLNIHNKRFGADFAKYAGPILLLANKEPFSNLSIIDMLMKLDLIRRNSHSSNFTLTEKGFRYAQKLWNEGWRTVNKTDIQDFLGNLNFREIDDREMVAA